MHWHACPSISVLLYGAVINIECLSCLAEFKSFKPSHYRLNTGYDILNIEYKLRDSQPNSNTPSGSDCGLFGWFTLFTVSPLPGLSGTNVVRQSHLQLHRDKPEDCYPTQSKSTDTGPNSFTTDSITLGIWQGSH